MKFSLSSRNLIQLAGVVLIVAALALAYFHLDTEAIREWKEDAPIVPFFIALALLPLVGLPTTPFFMVAGATYGILEGLVGTALALAANLVLSYLIIASGLRGLITRLLAKTPHRLPEIDKSNGARFTLVVRMVPAMPNFVKNYLLCLAGVPFGTYFLLSMVISFLYAAPFVVMGESIFEQDLRDLSLAAAALILLGLGARILYKKLSK